MTGQIEGKVAVVTGGAAGIGKASVELFVEEGGKVVIADVDTQTGEELANALGDAAIFQRCDVSQADEVQGVIDTAVDHFGGLDIMFNNAGISAAAFAHFLDDTMENFQQVMAVNVYGPMVGTQRAARYMKANGGGVVLITSSISGTYAGHAMMSYRASKAGVIQFAKSAAIDLGKHGVRVHCLVPGHIRTEMSSFNEKGVPEDIAQEIRDGVDAAYLANQIIKERGEPRDVAEAALFLASDRAKRMTGVVLPVECGVTIGDPVNHLEEIIDVRTRALAKMK